MLHRAGLTAVRWSACPSFLYLGEIPDSMTSRKSGIIIRPSDSLDVSIEPVIEISVFVICKFSVDFSLEYKYTFSNERR